MARRMRREPTWWMTRMRGRVNGLVRGRRRGLGKIRLITREMGGLGWV